MKEIRTSEVKIVAMIVMFLSHFASIFTRVLPDWVVTGCEFIGGMAFPLFAYLLVEGFFRTRDVKRYILRLALLWLVSIAPFYFAHNAVYTYPAGFDFTTIFQNTIFTLLCGLIMQKMLSETKNKWSELLILLFFMAITMLSDWGIIGIFVIFLYYRFHGSKYVVYMVPAAILFYWFCEGLYELYVLHLGVVSPHLMRNNLLQGTSALLIIPMLVGAVPQDKRSSRLFQWSCYLFYPVHLLLLAALAYRVYH